MPVLEGILILLSLTVEIYELLIIIIVVLFDVFVIRRVIRLCSLTKRSFLTKELLVNYSSATIFTWTYLHFSFVKAINISHFCLPSPQSCSFIFYVFLFLIIWKKTIDWFNLLWFWFDFFWFNQLFYFRNKIQVDWRITQ